MSRYRRVGVRRSEDNSGGGSRNGTQVVRLGSKCPHLRSHLAVPSPKYLTACPGFGSQRPGSLTFPELPFLHQSGGNKVQGIESAQLTHLEVRTRGTGLSSNNSLLYTARPGQPELHSETLPQKAKMKQTKVGNGGY